MSFEEINKSIGEHLNEHLPLALLKIVQRWNNKIYEGTSFYGIGIYMYTKFIDFSWDLYLTFLDDRGEEYSKLFLLMYSDEINEMLDDISNNRCNISKAFTGWTNEDSDILSKCEAIHDDGILITIGDTTNGSIRMIRNGRRIEFP